MMKYNLYKIYSIDYEFVIHIKLASFSWSNFQTKQKAHCCRLFVKQILKLKHFVVTLQT